jgi:hypothetical protein
LPGEEDSEIWSGLARDADIGGFSNQLRLGREDRLSDLRDEVRLDSLNATLARELGSIRGGQAVDDRKAGALVEGFDCSA